MFWSKPRRSFTVHGQIVHGCFADSPRTPGSVTLRARNHDDAESEAQASLLVGDGFFPDRWFKVDRVVEHRRR